MTNKNPPGTFAADAALLSAAITASGRSVDSFRHHVFPKANPRTIRRWLAGQEPLPPAVRARCQQIVAAAEAVAPIPDHASDREAGNRSDPVNTTIRNKEGSGG